jgi:O-antigen/teichoic acid export membrane protein
MTTVAPNSTRRPSQDAARAAQGTLALGALQVAGRLTGVAFLVIATRTLAPDDLGRYAIVAGLVAMAGFLADFGSTTVITRYVSADPDSSERVLAGTAGASWALGMLAWVAVVGYCAVGPYQGVVVVDAMIAGAAIPADAVLTSVLAAVDGHGLFVRRARISFLRVAIVAVGGGVGLLVTGDVRAAICAIAAGPLVAVAASLALARRSAVWSLAVRPDLAATRLLFGRALPYALLGGIGAIVARIDLVVLSAFESRAVTAQYDLALRAVEAVTTVGTVVGAPALYLLSRRLGSGDVEGARRAYREAARVAHLLGLPASALVVALHEPIGRVVFGGGYGDVGSSLAILGLSIWLAVLGWVQCSVVLAGARPLRPLVAFAGLLVVVVAVDAIAVPLWGAPGAAWATCGAAFASCVVFDRLNRSVIGMATPMPSLAVVVSALVTGVTAWGLHRAFPMGGAAAALLVLPLALVLTGEVRAGDVVRLRQLIMVRGAR